jgi:hypothetical protein
MCNSRKLTGMLVPRKLLQTEIAEPTGPSMTIPRINALLAAELPLGIRAILPRAHREFATMLEVSCFVTDQEINDHFYGSEMGPCISSTTNPTRASTNRSRSSRSMRSHSRDLQYERYARCVQCTRPTPNRNHTAMACGLVCRRDLRDPMSRNARTIGKRA